MNSAGRRFRPCVERLEDRAVPANYSAANASELIAAINAANLTAQADTITLAAGKSFTLTRVDNSDHGPTGLPVIAAGSGELTVIGNGSVIERSSVTGTPAFRLLDVAPGASLTLENMTLQGGLSFGYTVGGASGDSVRGGAVYNQGTLVLDGVIVQGNTAQGADGFSVWYSNAPGSDAFGGGLYSDGSLIMEGCVIRNNVAGGGRGGDGFQASRRILVSGSDGGSAYGGGLYVGGGTVTIRSSTFDSNNAQGGAGGVGYKGSGSGDKGLGVGGGIYFDPAADVGLDAFTIAHVKKNRASTSDPNIHGSYHVIP
jgi:hypothetical protein